LAFEPGQVAANDYLRQEFKMPATKHTLLAEVGELSGAIDVAVRDGIVSLSVPFGEQGDIQVERLVFNIEAANRRVVQTDGE
jgi:hypothetical protein